MAPNKSEPGELVLIHNHLMWVLGLLNRVPNVKINFIESETRRWTLEDGALMSSIANQEPV